MNEQLQDIVNDLPYSIRHNGSLEELIEYTKGQAERAQELEGFYKDMLDEATILNEQNKRYREALESIVNIDGYFIDKPFNMVRALNLIDGAARNALESESE